MHKAVLVYLFSSSSLEHDEYMMNIFIFLINTTQPITTHSLPSTQPKRIPAIMYRRIHVGDASPCLLWRAAVQCSDSVWSCKRWVLFFFFGIAYGMFRIMSAVRWCTCSHRKMQTAQPPPRSPSRTSSIPMDIPSSSGLCRPWS